MGLWKAAASRFTEIDGKSLGLIVSLELFTTMIPMIIIGFNYFSGFAEELSPGELLIREAGLVSPLSDRVRDAFGDTSALDTDWGYAGLTGFLLWGIPMALSISGIFGKAWRREQFGLGNRLWRGVLWFLMYLATIGLRQAIALGGEHPASVRVLLFVAGLAPVWIFWTLTPLLLVRDGGRGWRYLALAGLAGTGVSGVLIPLAARFFFPRMLDGWKGFGSIGVSMALITWCAVMGIGWVVSACVGAVLWERTAPITTVVEAQTADEPISGADRPAIESC